MFKTQLHVAEVQTGRVFPWMFKILQRADQERAANAQCVRRLSGCWISDSPKRKTPIPMQTYW